MSDFLFQQKKKNFYAFVLFFAAARAVVFLVVFDSVLSVVFAVTFSAAFATGAGVPLLSSTIIMS